MFIHRPFLTLRFNGRLDVTSIHWSHYLGAAQKSIDIVYSAFIHLHYFRSWWYNATHTLYASIITLHILLLDGTRFFASLRSNKEALVGSRSTSISKYFRLLVKCRLLPDMQACLKKFLMLQGSLQFIVREISRRKLTTPGMFNIE